MDQHTLRQFAIFLAVGGLTALLQLGIFALLLDAQAMNYSAAISVAYVAAVMFHFTLNRYVTFRSRSRRIAGEVTRYLGLVVLNYVITLAVVEVSVRLLRLPPIIGAAAAIGTTVIVTYLLSRYWVFAATTRDGESHKVGEDNSCVR